MIPATSTFSSCSRIAVSVNHVISIGGISTLVCMLFTLVLSFHISLEALDMRQSKAFLHGKDVVTLAPIMGQIPPIA